MCEAMENYGDERYEKGRSSERIANIRALITKKGFSVDEAFDIFDIPKSDRAALRERLM